MLLFRNMINLAANRAVKATLNLTQDGEIFILEINQDFGSGSVGASYVLSRAEIVEMIFDVGVMIQTRNQ